MNIKKSLYLILLIFLAEPALAKKAGKTNRVVEVNFEDELTIKGKVLGPRLFTLYQKRNIEFGKLIKPRKNFLPEMRTTLKDVE